ncbi:MAG: hypothetical protein WBN95_14500 [Gammaproteobacteria bacterium]
MLFLNSVYVDSADSFARFRRVKAPTSSVLHQSIRIIAMGESAAVKINNMVENIACGRVSPVEIIVCKANY